MDVKRGFEWFVCKFCRLESFPKRCQLVEHKKLKHFEDFMEEIRRRKDEEAEHALRRDEAVVDLTDVDEETGPVASSSASGGQIIGVTEDDDEVEVITILSQESVGVVVPSVAMTSTDKTGHNEVLAVNSEVSVESRTSLNGEVEALLETKLKREDEGISEGNSRQESSNYLSYEPSTDQRQTVHVVDVNEIETTPVKENRSGSENRQVSVPAEESTSAPEQPQQLEEVGTSPKVSGIRLVAERLRKYLQRKDGKIVSVQSSSLVISKKRKYSKTIPWYDKQRIARARRKIASDHLKQVCKKCRKILPSRTAWQEHMKEHEGKEPLSCPQCHFKLWTEERLSNHILKKHSANIKKQKISVEPYTCKQCEESFRRRQLLRSHLQKVHKATDFSDYHWDSDCSDDRGSQDDGSNSERGHVEVSRGKFICQFCPNTFKSERAWFEHNEEMHDEASRRREVVMEVKQGQAASEYSEENQNQGKENTDLRHVGDNRSIHSERTVEGLMNTTSVGDSLSCPVCNREFKLRIKVRAHMKKYHSKTAFTITSETTTRSNSLEEEENAKLSLPSLRKIAKGNQKATKEDQPFKCWECPTTFARRDDQFRHLKQEHGLSDSKVAEMVSRGVDSAYSEVKKRSNSSMPESPVRARQESLDKFVTVNCSYCGTDVQKAGLDAHILKNHFQHQIAGPSTLNMALDSGSRGPQVSKNEAAKVGNQQHRRHSSSSSSSSSSTSASDQTSTETVSTDKAQCFQFVLRKPKNTVRRSRCARKEPLQCSECGKSFVYQGAHDRHVIEKHNGDPNPDDPSENTTSSRKDKVASRPRKTCKSGQKKELHCPFCVGIFHEMTALEKHVIHSHSIKSEKAKEFIKMSMDSGEIYTGQQSSSATNVVRKANTSRTYVNEPAASASSSRKRSGEPNMSSSSTKRTKESRNSLPLNVGRLERREIVGESSRVAAPLNANYTGGSGAAGELSTNHYQTSAEGRVGYNVSLAAKLIPGRGPGPLDCHLFIEGAGFIPVITPEVGTGYVVKKEAKDDYNIKCSECNIRYDSEDKLREHEKVHLPKKYECPYCSASYVKEKWCVKHVKKTHTDAR